MAPLVGDSAQCRPYAVELGGACVQGVTNVIEPLGTALGAIQKQLARRKRVVYGVILVLIAFDSMGQLWFAGNTANETIRLGVAGLTLLGALLIWFVPRLARVVELAGFSLGGLATIGLLWLTLNGEIEFHAEAIRTYSTWLTLFFVWAFLALGSRLALAVSAGMLAAGTAVSVWHVATIGPLPTRAVETEATVDLALIGVGYLLMLYLLTHSLERRSAALAAEETAAKIMLLDPLTGTANRAAFHQLHQTYVRNPDAKPFALFLIDIDDFRSINERFGTAVGDDVLREMALRLNNTLGHDARIVARLGADEFGVIIEGELDEVQAAAAATLIGRACKPPFTAGGGPLQVTCTTGISRFPADAATLADQITQAEAAVASAKRTGEAHRLAVADAREAKLLALARDLREAVGRGELELEYQPIGAVRAQSSEERALGYVVGVEVKSFEALLRWRHPTFGLLPPLEFIPLAERTGLIVPLGEWVLHEACRQARAWQDEGVGPFAVSVNVSPHHFGHPGLLPTIEGALRESGLDPHHLVIEITETSADQPVVAERMERIRRLGVRVAIDDFGAGYSSLGRLHDLPIDFVKLDRSFVADMGLTDNRSAMVVGAAVQLAHGLGARVVAEGIERPEQAAAVAEVGCDYIQGFLLSKPVPAAEVAKLWRSGDTRHWRTDQSLNETTAVTGRWSEA